MLWYKEITNTLNAPGVIKTTLHKKDMKKNIFSFITAAVILKRLISQILITRSIWISVCTEDEEILR